MAAGKTVLIIQCDIYILSRTAHYIRLERNVIVRRRRHIVIIYRVITEKWERIRREIERKRERERERTL